jgi:enamine deaminase RidA (YjgF/YER057c/UK114 family)
MSITRHGPWELGNEVIEANGFVFTGGVVAEDLSQDMKGQTEQVLKDIDRLLAMCGTDKSKLITVTIFVNDIRDRAALNEAWLAWTGGKNLPGRACVEAKMADPAMRVEMMVVAAK